MEIREKDIEDLVETLKRKGIDVDTIITVADALRDVANDNDFDKEGFFDELLGMLE